MSSHWLAKKLLELADRPIVIVPSTGQTLAEILGVFEDEGVHVDCKCETCQEAGKSCIVISVD